MRKNTLIDLSRLPRQERRRRWTETLERNFVSMDCELSRRVEVVGRIDVVKAEHAMVVGVDCVSSSSGRSAEATRDGSGRLGAVLVLEGVGQSRQDGRTVEMRPGEIIIADTTRPYVADWSGAHRILIVDLPRTRLDAQFGSSTLLAQMRIGEAQGASPVIAFMRDLMAGADRLSPERANAMAALGTELVIGTIAHKLEDTISTPPLAAAMTMHRAKTYALAHLAEPELTPGAIARAVGISERSLHDLFQHGGVAPGEWIWRERLKVGRERLASAAFDHLLIGAVAWGCGFASQAHFSRRFKDAFGETPAAWREGARRARHAAGQPARPPDAGLPTT